MPENEWNSDEDLDGGLVIEDDDAADGPIIAADAAPGSADRGGGWVILIVDDEKDVHGITQFALGDFRFEGQAVTYLSAYSAAEAKTVIAANPNIALALVDVVMESDDAGLRLVEYIRNELKNKLLRVILRTGQPGQAPERQVVIDYDINNYLAKAELTAQKLFTAVLAGLRAYDQLRTIEWNRLGLEKILDASTSLFEHRSLAKFVDGVIMHIRSLVRNAEGALLCAVSESYYSGSADQVRVVAGVAPFEIKSGTPIREALSQEVCQNICRALDLQKSVYQDDHCIIFFKTVDHASTVIYLCGHQPLNEIDRHLLEVFCSKVAVGLDNVSLFEKICHESTHDTLTNLYNRGSFATLVEQGLAAMRQGSPPVAVLVLNLDRFADVNQELGFEAGDAYLQAIADSLRCVATAEDVLARLGGDEFALLLRGIDSPRQARLKAEMVESALAEPIRLVDQEVQPRASIGVAIAADDSRAEDLIALADGAMHQSKNRGGGRIQIHPSTPTVKRPEGRLRLVSDLAHALERDQLELYYQPIVRLADERLAGFEALLRWNHPQRGLVMPGSFIELAEATGMIVPMGAWVIRRAVHQMAEWSQRHAGASDLMMSVNVSARQFDDHDMAEEIRSILSTTAPNQITISASRLKIEVTESLIMGDTERAVITLKDLKNMGAMLALDDFGTGYASLSYLYRFPFDIIKIDRSFVSSMRQQPQSMAIVRTICALARELGLDIVAEGAEWREEVDVLRELGVSLCQGYYFSRPLTADAAERLIAGSAR